MMNLSLRRRLLVSTIAAGAVFGATPAWAKEGKPVQADQAAPAEDNKEAASDVVVTGTLLRNPNLLASNPVNVVSEKEIQLRQSNTAEDLLRQLPAVVPNIGSAVNNGNGGASFVDLRGLGSNRNLVLIDGVRLVPANLGGAFDLNNIPLALIQRVDALTGGAATTYGADAVAGVVNFITKQDFSGIDLSVSQQITGRGDGNTLRADLTMGANLDGGRGNVVFSIGYQKSDAVYQGDREFSEFNIDSASGGAGGSGTTVPTRFSLPGLGSRQINPDTGDFQPNNAFNAFNFNPFNIFNTPFQRFNMYGAGRYEINDNLEVYARGIFSRNSVDTIIAPSGAFGLPVDLPLSNPFLPVGARNTICNAFATSTLDLNPNQPGVQGLNAANCAAAAAATGPNDPNYRQVRGNLSRRSVEFGPRTSNFTTTIFDYRMGFRGSITDRISWDVFGAYGQSENVQTQGGYVLNSRVRQSLLTTGVGAAATCVDQSNGCVPVNWFGAAGTLGQANFLTAPSTTKINTSLAQFRGTISGDFGVKTPWANDPISFAVAGEYRNYTASQQSDLLSVSGDLGGGGGAAPNIVGGYQVYEGIGEVVIPVIQDKRFFKSLTLEAGIRYSSYSIAAANNPSFAPITWTFRGSWEPVDHLRFRGTFSRAVRNPNIAELFNPQNVVLTNLNDDPCANLQDNGQRIPGRANPTGALRDVCIAQGAPANLIGLIGVPTAGQAQTTTGGNINLRPEVSTSFTAGFVLTNPIPGFTMSVDYWNIGITGAISTPNPADVINACFNNVSLANPSCGRNFIGRDPLTGQLSGDPRTTPGLFLGLSNLGQIYTSGFDFAANYRRNIGFGTLTFDFVGTFTTTNKFRATPASVNRECVNFYSVNCGSIQPDFQFNQRTTLTIDKFDFTVLWRFINGVQYEPGEPVLFNGPVTALGGQTVNFNRIPSYHYIDLGLRYAATDRLSVLFSIQNLFNAQPPITGSTAGTTAFNSGNTYPSTYDTLGRRFAVTARFRM